MHPCWLPGSLTAIVGNPGKSYNPELGMAQNQPAPQSIYTWLVRGFNHLEKYVCQWEGLSRILWKIKIVPNHQPYIYNYIYILCMVGID